MIAELLSQPSSAEAAALGVLFLASVCRGTFGFGDGLIATPLLTLLLGARTASPIVALVSAVTAALMLGGSWRDVAWPEVRRLVLSAAVGIPVGVVLLGQLPAFALELALGLLVLGFVAKGFLRGSEDTEKTEKLWPAWVWLCGFGAGMLSGLWNAPGPPAVMFGRASGWKPERFRASLQAFFLPTMIFVVLGHWLADLHKLVVWRVFAWDVPGLLIALTLGRLLRGRIPQVWFERTVAGLLALVALLLLGRGVGRLI